MRHPLLLGALGLPLQASLLFDQSPPITTGLDITKHREADDFTLLQASTVSAINFWYGAPSQNNLISATWIVYAKNGGAVGPVISSGTASPLTSLDPSVNRFFATFSGINLSLAAAEYWLEIQDSTNPSDTTGPFVLWSQAASNGTHSSVFNTLAVPSSSTAGLQLAFQIVGAVDATSVPEPATYAMFAAGLGLIVLRKGAR